MDYCGLGVDEENSSGSSEVDYDMEDSDGLTIESDDYLTLESGSEFSNDEDNDERSPISLFKLKVEEVFKKVTDRSAGEFCTNGKLDDAPMVIISLKNASIKRMRFPLYEVDSKEIFESCMESRIGGTALESFCSWEVYPEEFEILNPDWDEYIQNALKPRIADEMFIDFPFTVSLCKLVALKRDFKQCNFDKKDGIFATLMIQLPSKFNGGQLIVKHDEKTMNIDFSSSNEDRKDFSTFFSAFYNDCQYELRPVTEGLRLCLVYNLISQNSDCIPMVPGRNVYEEELKSLFQNWNAPGKIVYIFKEKYAEKTPSMEELRGSDKTIAKLLKQLSKECNLEVYLSLFQIIVIGMRNGFAYPGDDDDEKEYKKEDVSGIVIHGLSKLFSLAGPALISNSKLIADIREDIIPEEFDFERFLDRKPANKYYHAISFWPVQFTLEVLKDSPESTNSMISVFIEEVKKYQEGQKDEKSKERLITSAKIVGGSKYEEIDNDLKIRLLTALVEINDLTLLQDFLEKFFIMDETILPFVKDQFKIHGWETFSKQLISLFKKVTTRKASVELFKMLIGEEKIDKTNKKIFHNAFNAILGKFQLLANHTAFPRILNELTFCERANVIDTQDNDIKLLKAAAIKIDFNMVKLLQAVYGNFIFIELKSIPSIANDCKTYGWKSFASQLPKMFNRVIYPQEAMEMLNLLMGTEEMELIGDKKLVCRKVFDVILKKFKDLASYDKKCTSSWGINDMKLAEEQKNLYLICSVARKVKADMLEYFKGKPISVTVFVLIQLANTGEPNVLDEFWMPIAKDLVTEMDENIAKSIPTPTWKVEVMSGCVCKICKTVDKFLQNDTESETIKIEKKQRKHLSQKLKIYKNLAFDFSYFNDELFIKKLQRIGQEEFNMRNISEEFLPKLVAVLPR